MNIKNTILELEFIKDIEKPLLDLLKLSEKRFIRFEFKEKIEALEYYLCNSLWKNKYKKLKLNKLSTILIKKLKRITKYDSLIEKSILFNSKEFKKYKKYKQIPNEINSVEISLEWKRYLETVKNMNFKNINQIKWWNNRRQEMGNLYAIAIRYLHYPFNISSVERSFSVLKDIVKSNRNKLSKENIAIELKLRINK